MIRVLDEKLINKIAAGEVIDRPVNVVKELVENAVDARAEHVSVEISENCIRVVDDGSGMSKEDLEQSILRHATSKISFFEDLEHISTLGFRGEALSSIAAVSSFTLLSKTEDMLEGYELVVEGGVVQSFKAKACPQGTVVEVRDLFFNTPVRKKFLDGLEEERIVGFIEKFALGAHISIRLRIRGKLILDVQSRDPLERIGQVWGFILVKDMIAIKYNEGNISFEGYVSKPSHVRKDRSMQAIFVNGRLVESEEISSGLYEAYKSLLFVNKHPVAVIHVRTGDVDVNVHPTKKIIKFSHPGKISSVVFDAIRLLFLEVPLDFSAAEIPLSSYENVLPSGATIAQKAENIRFVKEVQRGLAVFPVFDKKYTHFPEMKILGNIAKTFFLAETKDGLMIIDQHVVEERINYEKFMKQFMKGEVVVQDLLVPELLEFSAKEAMNLRSKLILLREYGFYLEEFGENTFRLEKVPILFNKVKGEDLLRDLLVDFKDEEKEDIITMMSCKKSIKAGDSVTISDMYRLLLELDKCELPYTCPHGRPIMVKLALEDMEKMFRRKGF
ncbi:MAG: DNA mismatch repair endonuclease MutL [bacterium]|nr:DNA mismatch repair endonuclease MutL [bacterium]